MSNPKGRPVGYRLSAKSKAKISATKTGQKHSTATKVKIAASVVEYFDNNPTPAMIAKDNKIMCRTRHRHQQSLRMLRFWKNNPLLKLMLSEVMTDWHASKKTEILAQGDIQ